MIINNWQGWGVGAIPFLRDLSLGKDYNGEFPVHLIRRDFPILSERINGKQLVWLDNAATTQKPQCVIDRLADFYRYENSNVHRGAHTLAARATDAYEDARKAAARFLHAKDPKEIIFVRGATEAINLVARTYGSREVGLGDELIVTHLEHHANIVPWQQLCQERGAFLRVVPVDETGQVILEEYEKLFCRRTKLVSLPHVSNALGTVVPVKEMIRIAHAHGIRVLVDGAQAVSHLPVDVQELDCDFYAFSGHKIYGPTGIGILYGKGEILHELPPYQGGGNMIADVTFEKTRYQEAPERFEAGTGSIGDAAALGAALDYVSTIGMERIARYEHELTEYAMKRLMTVKNLIPVGTAEAKTSILSFVIKNISNDQVGKALNEEGIAVRTGHHCAQPILRRFGLESTVRPSLSFYNTKEEVDRLVSVLVGIPQVITDRSMSGKSMFGSMF
ncbi:MAG: cysteine desulfurase [Bacillota bacterium]|jgi:cysteine desulfurase/selenocysteine lyase|nr:cysteine desulfurase [Bacillota bacterium]